MGLRNKSEFLQKKVMQSSKAVNKDLTDDVETEFIKGSTKYMGIAKPDIIWKCRNHSCSFKDLNQSKKIQETSQKPLNSLKKLMDENKLELPNNIPSIATGLFGYMGYEMIQHFENIKLNKKNVLDLLTQYLFDLL